MNVQAADLAAPVPLGGACRMPHTVPELIFEPRDTRAMCIAFRAAWRRLKTSRHACTVDGLASETQNQLARRIIEKAAEGEVNPIKLRDHALPSLFPLGLDFEANHSRSWLARIVPVEVRSANRSVWHSLMRFSISPRAQ